jgi:glycolate oxidase FAD binding subunit
VRFVDWQGQLVSSGGKVVKNAAGFDLPKLMIGSLGQYGILAELAFKVFPRPEAYATLQVAYPMLEEELRVLTSLTQQPFELFALDLVPRVEGAHLRVRLGGKRASIPERIRRLQSFLESADVSLQEGQPEMDLWRAEVEFSWAPAGYALVKVPLTPRRVLELDERLAAAGASRHYSVGANQAWIAWPGEISTLDALLNGQNLSGLLVRGAAHNPRLGVRSGDGFARRVKQALDPHAIFPGAFDAA